MFLALGNGNDLKTDFSVHLRDCLGVFFPLVIKANGQALLAGLENQVLSRVCHGTQ